MSKTSKSSRRRSEMLQVILPAVFVTLIGFVVAYQFVEPAPPNEITIAAGTQDGAYYRYALQYKEVLSENGITLHVRATRGSGDNLKQLEDATSGVDIALTQSGTATIKDDSELVSLGSLYYEPLWIFCRGAPPKHVRDLKGKRIAIGQEGSGTIAVTERLLADNGITTPSTNLLPLGGTEAAEGLRNGEVDIAFFVYAIETPLVQELLLNPEMQLLSVRRTDAYTRRYRYLASVTLPEGVIDLKRNLPPQDVKLLAPVALLTARSDFHPALVDLLLAAAQQVHGEVGIFEETRQFPSPEHTDFPLSPEAKRFLERGPSFFSRFLPFWAANFADRMLVMMIPLLTLLIPLIKLAPPLYSWRVRSKFKRWYRDLQTIDIALARDSQDFDYEASLSRLKIIQTELAKITVPPTYGDELYNLRFHTSLVEEKVKKHAATERTKSGKEKA